MDRRGFFGALSAAFGTIVLPEPPKLVEPEPIRTYSFAKHLRVPGVETVRVGAFIPLHVQERVSQAFFDTLFPLQRGDLHWSLEP